MQVAPTGSTPLTDLSAWNGTWRFEYFTLTKMAPATPEQAKANLGKLATIDGAKVHYEGIDCVAHRVENTQLPTDPYLRSRFNLARKEVNITAPTVSVVTTDCDGTPFAEFIERPGELVFFVDGVLYFLRQPVASP